MTVDSSTTGQGDESSDATANDASIGRSDNDIAYQAAAENDDTASTS